MLSSRKRCGSSMRESNATKTNKIGKKSLRIYTKRTDSKQKKNVNDEDEEEIKQTLRQNRH